MDVEAQLSDSFRKRHAYRERGIPLCTSPVMFRGQLRPCRQCTSCAYGQAQRKVALLSQEIDPTRESYFLTLTYDDTSYQTLMLPPKPEGELTAGQQHLANKWQQRIFELGEKRRTLDEFAPDGDKAIEAMQARINYRQEKLDDFLEHALRPLPSRPSICRAHGPLWQKRFLEVLRLDNPKAKLPRMVLKYELGSKGTRRPHIHVLMLHPTAHELSTAIRAWGHLYVSQDDLKSWRMGIASPVLGNWHELSMKTESDRGHVHVLPVTDDGVSTYVTKDLYRGQDAAAYEYISKGVEPPSIQWPRNPGMGCGGWMERIREQWNFLKQHLSPLELELSIQDTRSKSTSLRHALRDYKAVGTKLANGMPREKFQKLYMTCPPSVWARFTQSIEDERDSDAREQVREYLEARNQAEDSAPGFRFEQRHKAVQAGLKRLRNWQSICVKKGVPLPDYAIRERDYVQNKLVNLVGGQVAHAVVGDQEPLMDPRPRRYRESR